MADTAYGVNANEAVKLWSAKLAREALKKTYLKNFMGEGSDSLIQVRNETNKGPGDRIRITLRMQLTGRGIIGDGTQEGNEESLTTFTDDLIINQLRHAVRSEGKMTEQRIPFNIRSEAMMGLSDWWASRWDIWGFYHLAGFTPGNAVSTGDFDTDSTGPEFNGHNTIVAPSRQVFPSNVAGTAYTTDEGIAAGATPGAEYAAAAFSLLMIDKAVERAKVGSLTGVVPIRPVKVDGKDYFVVFLHPYQVTDLRTSGSASTVTWFGIHSSEMQGGKLADNPIFTGALGIYNGCILHESVHVPEGVNSTLGTTVAGVRRAVLCGAQSLLCGFGQGHDETSYSWFEQLFDYGNKLGVKAGCIAGLKKARFNSQDFGTVVMSSAAAPH
jgi:N4-gp56 family major capsid protein